MLEVKFTLNLLNRLILLSCIVEENKIAKIDLKFTDRPKTDKKYLDLLEKIILKLKGDYKKDDFYYLNCPKKHRIVYNKLVNVKFGERLTYSDLSDLSEGIPPILVGQILSKNPLPLIIPCHRVIGKNGDLKGFSCGLEIKKLLLKLEEEGHEISYIQ